MERIILESRGYFKHTNIWHLIPDPRIVLERLPKKWLLSFEITFGEYTAYITFGYILNLSEKPSGSEGK